MSPLLTQGEYDNLPQEAKDALAQVVRFPHHDVHDHSYRRRFGPYRNGELYGDPIVRQRVGFGKDSPFTSHPIPVEGLDEFNSLDESYWEPNGVVSVVNGNLVLDATDDFSFVTTRNQYDFTEASFSVEIVDLSVPLAPAFPVVLQDSLASHYYVYWWLQEGYIQAWYGIPPTDDEMLWQGSYNSLYRHLRIRESAGRTYWEHSPDGELWVTDFDTPNLIDMTSLLAGIFALPSGIVTYDNAICTGTLVDNES